MLASRLLLPTVLLAACVEPPLQPREPTPGVPHFRVATYNLLFEREGDASTLAAVGATNGDIVALQEVNAGWEASLRAEYSDLYPYMHFETKNGAGGMAVLSRYPLRDAGLQPSPIGRHPSSHVVIDSPVGPLVLLNVHLRSLLSGNSNAIEDALTVDEDHLGEIQAAWDACDGSASTLVVGDFNEGPDGRAIRMLEGLGFRNALPLFHPGEDTWRYSTGALGSQLAAAVDHVLFDSELDPLDARVLQAGRSDHLPVVAHLELSQN